MCGSPCPRCHQVLGRRFHVVEEHLARIVVHHRADRPMVSPLPSAAFMSTMKVDSPSVRLATWSFGVVRASSRHQVGMLGARGPDLLAVDDVLVAFLLGEGAQVGGVGAALRLGHAEGRNRNSPVAIFGRYFAFCSGLPCLRMVPMMCIWAWQAAALAPLEWISSRIAAAARAAGPTRHIPRGSTPKASRPRSAPGRIRSDSRGGHPARASIRRGSACRACAPPRGSAWASFCMCVSMGSLRFGLD